MKFVLKSVKQSNTTPEVQTIEKLNIYVIESATIEHLKTVTKL